MELWSLAMLGIGMHTWLLVKTQSRLHHGIRVRCGWGSIWDPPRRNHIEHFFHTCLPSVPISTLHCSSNILVLYNILMHMALHVRGYFASLHFTVTPLLPCWLVTMDFRGGGKWENILGCTRQHWLWWRHHIRHWRAPITFSHYYSITSVSILGVGYNEVLGAG